MRIISRRRLREYWKSHADAEVPLSAWYSFARKAKWKDLIDVRRTYAGAEAVDNFTVFNIKGNTYRLIVRIFYLRQTIYIDSVLTHAEYDKDKWK